MDTVGLTGVAVIVAELGMLAWVSMMIFRLALRHLDWNLVPASAVRRARWWRKNADIVRRCGALASATGAALLFVSAVPG